LDATVRTGLGASAAATVVRAGRIVVAAGDFGAVAAPI
jgi:hypothetical protein